MPKRPATLSTMMPQDASPSASSGTKSSSWLLTRSGDSLPNLHTRGAAAAPWDDAYTSRCGSSTGFKKNTAFGASTGFGAAAYNTTSGGLTPSGSRTASNAFSSNMENWLRDWSSTGAGLDMSHDRDPAIDSIFGTFNIMLEGGGGGIGGGGGGATQSYNARPSSKANPPGRVPTADLLPDAASARRALRDACTASDVRDAGATLAALRDLARLLGVHCTKKGRSTDDVDHSSDTTNVDLRRQLDEFATTDLFAASAVDAVLRIMRLPPGWSGREENVELECDILDAAGAVVGAL